MCTLPFHVHIVHIKNVHNVHIIFSCAHCAHKRCAQNVLKIDFNCCSIKGAMDSTMIDAFLHGYVLHFGVPCVIITDRGAQFESAFLNF